MTLPPAPRGRYTRGYLPHVDHPGLVQFITFGLADASPPHDADHDRADPHTFGDRGSGSCVLRAPELASIVDGARYELGPWVIMPNHVHVVVRPFADRALAEIVQSWKSYTSKRINERLGRSGRLWMREYFDQFVRDQEHLDAVTRYIHQNPVAAGLVGHAGEWPFSSARGRRDAGGPVGE